MDATDVRVAAVESVGPDTIAIDLETPPEFTAEPGQFVLFRVDVDGEEITRYYTLSSPRVGETFEVTVGIDPEGDLSPWLADLEAGDAVTVEGPFGEVYYEGDGPVLALAGGPGVGPAVAIAERALAEGEDAAVVYLDETPAHERRLAALAEAGADAVVVGDEDAFAAAVAERAHAGTPFVFGFREFCDLARDALSDAGRDPEDARIESFG